MPDRKPIEQSRTGDDYDVVVIGGAFAGASAALLLRRWRPDCRVLIVERQERFTRKVGEATVEVSGCFLQRVLGLYDHLSREHLPKHGLRFWFSDDPNRPLSEMSEVGASEIPGLPSFQLDRSKLDAHVLRLAEDAGAEVARPARVKSIDHGWPESRVRVLDDSGERDVRARWVIDASGRQAFIARRMKLQQRVDEHPTAAIWARWDGIADLDGPSVLGEDPDKPRLPRIAASRRLGTNHFCGYGWWCWVIPLSGGQTSIGLVYNKDIVQMEPGRRPRDTYRDFILSRPGLRDLVAGATLIEDDLLALTHLPYKTSRYMEPGWALVGDAAAFIDPYYSPGLDFGSISVYATAKLIADDLGERLDGAALPKRIAAHNDAFVRSYDRWISALYADKYELMGDAELTACAFLVDTSLYYLGMVGPVYGNPDVLRNPTFGPPIHAATVAYRVMRFFNRRLLHIARFRRQVGTYGRRNAEWRLYVRAFGTKHRVLGPLLRGARLWLRLELEYLVHRIFKGRVEVSRPVPATLDRKPA